MLKKGPGIGGGGGGGGSGILVESGSAVKISGMSTLANPPLAGVYEAVITNDGTTASNFQRPQGVIVQPDAVGANNGLGITLQGGAGGPAGGNGGSLQFSGGAADGGDAGFAYFAGGYSIRGLGGSGGFFAGSSEYDHGGALRAYGGASNYGPSGYVDIQSGFPGKGIDGGIGMNASTSVVSKAHAWLVGANPNGVAFFVAARPMRVTAIIGRLNAANALASTLTVVKAPSGTAVASGTALTTNTFDAAGTPNTNQTLTLVANAAGTTLLTFTGQPGDGETVTIGPLTYTFQTSLNNAVAYNVKIGASATASITNLVAAINGSAGGGTTYSTPTLASLFVTGTVATGSTATIDYAGAYGGALNNGVVTTTDVTGGSFTGATLAGGTSTVELAAGDSLGIKTTGTWALAGGCITVHMTWLK